MTLRSLGPGILLAATSVGASHLLMSPEAGARFGYQLVWLVLLVHLVKYPAFELAPRYVAGRGESLLEAYREAPGPRHWALWLGLVDMSLQAVGVLAALIGLTASFLVGAAAELGLSSLGSPARDLGAWSLGLVLVLLALVRWGRYGSLRAVNLVLMLALSLGTLVAFAAAPPPAQALPTMLSPALPAGSLLLVAAILGYMPTSVAVSIWQSLWALEHGRFRPGRGDSPESRRSRLKAGLFDLRLGYGLSALLAVAFVSLGATLLHPRGLVPEGPDVALTLSSLYTLVLGEWMRPVFLGMAFCALFTTCYTSIDGFPRTFVATLRVLRGRKAVADLEPEPPAAAETRGERRIYWIFLLAATFGGMALLAAVPDPVAVVKVVGALGLLLSPIYFALNLWAVQTRVTDPDLRPGPATLVLAAAGFAVMLLGAGLLLWTAGTQ